MTFALVPYRELIGAGRYGEMPGARVMAQRGTLVAIAGEFPQLYWPGRAVYDGQHPRYRVAIYDGERRIAVHDEIRHQINDLAFHPTEPVLAIGAGQYDGGYLYEGQLYAWAWESGRIDAVLGESRTVDRCRFDDDGRLSILLRPATDQDFESSTARLGVVLDDLTPTTESPDPRLRGLAPIDPSSLHFDDQQDDLLLHDGLASLALPARGPIWDIAWLANGRIAVAHDDGRVQLWTPHGERVFDHHVTGRAMQLFARGESALVHGVDNAETSTLYTLDDTGLVRWYGFSTSRTCSVNATGHVLARGTQHGHARPDDTLLAPSGKVVTEDDLGAYDVFNHFLRIDGAEDVYYLRGMPIEQHRNKQLCKLDDRGAFDEVLQWDDPEIHRMCSHALQLGGDFVRCYQVYSGRGDGPILVERISPPRDPSAPGEVRWRVPVRALATSLVHWPAADTIVIALLDGTLLALDPATGAVLHRDTFTLDGVRTIVYALAVLEDMLAIGTINGQLALYASQ